MFSIFGSASGVLNFIGLDDDVSDESKSKSMKNQFVEGWGKIELLSQCFGLYIL